MNYSKVRNEILNIVYTNQLHLTAEQVYQKIHSENAKIGIATVYRNLAKLVEEGQIQKICGLGNADRYDGNVNKHFHFYCEECGRVYDIAYPEENINNKIEQISGHKVLNHDFIFYGICKDCRKE